MFRSRAAIASRVQCMKLVTLALRRFHLRASLASNIVPRRAAHNMNVISPNIGLITNVGEVLLDRGTKSALPRVVQASGRPLAVILSWLTSKPGAVYKYATLYLDQGFDVLTVNLHPWQSLWPVNGSQVVASELLEFLRLNYSSEPLMLHGFSIGCYLWGEVCVKMSVNGPLYQPILDRVIGQVWDSGAVETIAFIEGFSSTIFPRNATLRAVMQRYLKYHLLAFREIATKHYDKATNQFLNNPLKAPALFLVSKTDLIGTEESNRNVHDTWAAQGVQTYWKSWDNVPHVEIFRRHPKEYTEELHAFFDRLGITQNLQMRRSMI